MNREQFIEHIAQEQEPLRRFLRILCDGDGFKADDIAQEAMLKAYLSFERFEGKSRFSTWLFRIAYNCFYDAGKRDGRTQGEGLSDRHERLPGDENADGRYEYQALHMAIEDLQPHEKAVVLLFYMEDKSINDIVQITGIPSGTVRAQLSRARVHLKQFLTRYEDR